MSDAHAAPTVVTCAPMTAATRPGAYALLGEFLREDGHYLASSRAYGDGGGDALARALDLFLDRPELGFVWLASAGDGAARRRPAPVSSATPSRRRAARWSPSSTTSPSPGTGRGGAIGSAMLAALGDALRARGVTRIDTACHRDNAGAWRFYERMGFRSLDEERIALLLDRGSPECPRAASR